MIVEGEAVQYWRTLVFESWTIFSVWDNEKLIPRNFLCGS